MVGWIQVHNQLKVSHNQLSCWLWLTFQYSNKDLFPFVASNLIIFSSACR
jgi:hypothetical protein